MELLLPLGLLGLGLVLVIAEIMFPSFGVLSILATICIVGSLVVAYQHSSSMGTGFLAATAIGVPLAMVFGFKWLPKSPMARHLMAEGFSFEDGAVSDPRDQDLLNAEGEVLSTLRPAGTARLENRRVDVVSRGEVIEAGQRVRVIELRGNRVVVALVQEADSA
jgi:membrane-bound serine protease (ClpP class)